MVLKYIRATASLLLAVVLVIPWAAAAADFPERPIKLIVTFPPGGGSDLLGRALGKSLSEAVGQPVLIENMPGAYGSVGGAHLARAAGDGYTLMLAQTGTVVLPAALGVKLPYDTLKDFTPLVQIATGSIVLVVHPSFPASTFAEFAAHLKSNPPNANFYATWGVGSVGHFAGELLKTKADLAMVHVAYKGAAPLINDLLSGHVKIGFSEATTAAPLLRSGKLRGLAVVSPKRAPGLPDLPTLAEVGIPFAPSIWYGLVGPKNMPTELVARINTVMRRILESDDMRQKFIAMGLISSPSTPQEFRKIIENDNEVWSEVAKTSGIKVD